MGQVSSTYNPRRDNLTRFWRLRDRAVSTRGWRLEEAERQADLGQIGLLCAQIERILSAEKLHSMCHSRLTEATSVLVPKDAARFSGHQTLGIVMHYYRTTPVNVANKLRAATQQMKVSDKQDEMVRLIEGLDDRDSLGFHCRPKKTNKPD